VSQMLQRGRVGLIAIFFLGVATIACLWYFKPEPAKRPPAKPSVAIVEILVADPQTYQANISSQGTVAPKRQINLVAEVSGRVVNINDDFVNGGFFQSGETLVQLDDRDYRYALRNAEAQVANAERELALEKGQARQAKRVWRNLGSAEANALSLREPQVKAARLSLKAAKAEQQRSSLNIQRASISVPFDGRVESANINLGQFVPVGSNLGSVFDSSTVEVRLPLSNDQFALLGILPNSSNTAAFEAVSVELSAIVGGQTYQWPAKLSRVEASIDSKTRLFHIITEVDQPFDSSVHDYPLIVGLFVQANIKGKKIENVIAIPKKAVLNQQVFVLGKRNKVELKQITLIDRDADRLFVKVNIERGEKIVVSDPRVLKEGASVKVKGEQAKPKKIEPQSTTSKES